MKKPEQEIRLLKIRIAHLERVVEIWKQRYKAARAAKG